MKPSDQRVELVGDRDLADAAQLLQDHGFFVCQKANVVTVQTSEQVTTADRDWLRSMRSDFDQSVLTRLYDNLVRHIAKEQMASIRHEEDFGRGIQTYTARLNIFRPPSGGPIVKVPVMPLLPWERPST